MRKSLFLINIFTFIFISNAFSADLNYEITAKKLDKSRGNLSPKTYGTSFNFDRDNIDNLPQGQASSLNQILLRAPGVTQDSYGQIHIRNDHSNIQYRINDVIIPEGITGFGNVLDARFVDSVNLLTGALPAQYGYRNAGVVEIKTKDRAVKNSTINNGAYTELLAGTNNDLGVNVQSNYSKNKFNSFLSASYLQNSRGIESPTSARKSIHNDSGQDKLFGYFSYLIDAKKRLSLIIANANNRYQIPNIANQEPQFSLANQPQINSSAIRSKQSENNSFAILSLQGVTDKEIDYQLSSFIRYNNLKYKGDEIGELIFAGASSKNSRSSINSGFQGDFSKKLNSQNILRTGFYLSNNIISEKNSTATFLMDEEQQQLDDSAIYINDRATKSTQLYSTYIQNEYKPIESLTLNAGLRYDGVNSAINDNALSPRFNGVYEINERTKIHAGYSKFFTAPKAEILSNLNINLFQNTSNASENFVNDKVKSEKTDYYNLGINFLATKQFRVGVDTYYKDIDNMLDEGQFGSALIFKPFNYHKAKVYGVELSSDYKLQNFTAFANFAFQKAKAFKINSGQYLHEDAELDYTSQYFVNPDHAQRYSASAGVAYNFTKTKTNLGFDVLYGNGLRRGEANRHRMKSYSQLNIFMLQKIQKFNLRLAINNVLDKKYALRDGSGIGVQAPQFAMRRSTYLILSREF